MSNASFKIAHISYNYTRVHIHCIVYIVESTCTPCAHRPFTFYLCAAIKSRIGDYFTSGAHQSPPLYSIPSSLLLFYTAYAHTYIYIQRE